MPSDPPDKKKEHPPVDRALPDIPTRQDLPDESTVVDRILITPKEGEPFIIIRTDEIDEYERDDKPDNEREDERDDK